MKKQTQQQKNISLKESLQTGDVKKIKKLIDETLDSSLTSEEKGELYTGLVSSYLKMTNEVQSAYIETLESAIKALNTIDTDEKKADEFLQKETVKKKLLEIDDLD